MQNYKKGPKGKKGTIPALLVSLFAVVGLIAVIYLGVTWMGGSKEGAGLTVVVDGDKGSDSGSGSTGSGNLNGISLVEDTTVTFSATDVYDDTVNIGGNHQYKVNGGAVKTVANLGTDTLSPGDKVKVKFGHTNTSGTVVYLQSVQEFTVTDRGTYEAKAELYRNGSITSRIFNQEGNLIDDVTENETLSAGDTPSLKWELEGQFERGQFANGGCAIFEYNTTTIDDVVLKVTKKDGAVATNKKIDTPDYFSVRTAGYQAKTYSIPPFISNEIVEGSITVDVDDNNDPPGLGDDIFIHYRPNEWRYNSNSKDFELFTCGEDQDGNRVSNPVDSQLDILQVD